MDELLQRINVRLKESGVRVYLYQAPYEVIKLCDY